MEDPGHDGLIDDSGSGDARRIQLTELAWRILTDSRPGAKEQALKDAGSKPRLFAEYLAHWLPETPSDNHRVSELTLDRGFNKEAAHAFIRAFDETVAFAHLTPSDTVSPVLETPGREQMERSTADRATSRQAHAQAVGIATEVDTAFALQIGPRPFNQRFKIEMTDNAIGVTATLLSAAEIEKLIRILEANKSLLPAEAPESAPAPVRNIYDEARKDKSGS